MEQHQSFCLNATHGISSRSMEALYTLLVKDLLTGKGHPVAYMVTNDQSVSPVNQ